MATADETDDSLSGDLATGVFWYDDVWGFRAVVVYLLLSVVGIAAVSRPGMSLWAEGDLAGSVGIPVYVFGFALLGALTYVFTSVLSNYDSHREKVFEAGLRIPAALLLAAGVYLLASLVAPSASSGADGAAIGGESLAAGLAFIVGLYVKLTLEALGGVADALYNGIGREK
jgi:hypothetical protein